MVPEVVRLKYASSVVTPSVPTIFLPFFLNYDLHPNCHKICSDTISIGGVAEILRVSYKKFKAFVGGRGRINIANSGSNGLDNTTIYRSIFFELISAGLE